MFQVCLRSLSHVSESLSRSYSECSRWWGEFYLHSFGTLISLLWNNLMMSVFGVECSDPTEFVTFTAEGVWVIFGTTLCLHTDLWSVWWSEGWHAAAGRNILILHYPWASAAVCSTAAELVQNVWIDPNSESALWLDASCSSGFWDL